jgi:hypothetical protein
MRPERCAASFCTQSSQAVGAELRALRFDRDDLGCYGEHGCKRVPVLVTGEFAPLLTVRDTWVLTPTRSVSLGAC